MTIEKDHIVSSICFPLPGSIFEGEVAPVGGPVGHYARLLLERSDEEVTALFYDYHECGYGWSRTDIGVARRDRHGVAIEVTELHFRDQNRDDVALKLLFLAQWGKLQKSELAEDGLFRPLVEHVCGGIKLLQTFDELLSTI